MKLAWLFSDEAPLPRGYRLVVLHHETGMLVKRRLGEAGEVIGPEAVRDTAQKLGRYELDDDTVRKLGLAGARVGVNGEFETLSPERWVEAPEAEGWETPEEGSEVAGVLLSRSQRESFLKFLTRNHENEDGELNPEKVVRLARHFFFQEPIVVVLRYTPPRFARG